MRYWDGFQDSKWGCSIQGRRTEMKLVVSYDAGNFLTKSQFVRFTGGLTSKQLLVKQLVSWLVSQQLLWLCTSHTAFMVTVDKRVGNVCPVTARFQVPAVWMVAVVLLRAVSSETPVIACRTISPTLHTRVSPTLHYLSNWQLTKLSSTYQGSSVPMSC